MSIRISDCIQSKISFDNHIWIIQFILKQIIGTHFEECLIIKSQLFGLCSHTKYSSKYLTKVFVEELKQIYTAVKNDYFNRIILLLIFYLFRLITILTSMF